MECEDKFNIENESSLQLVEVNPQLSKDQAERSNFRSH